MNCDIPVIFSAPMILALLAGRKTMTRRLAWRSCKLCGSPGTCKGPHSPSPWQRTKPGDRLWVRENFRPVHSGDPAQGAKYMADVGRDDTKWKPSIHMPRWASRLTLDVADVKVEPLQAMSDSDAEREGCVEDWADGLSVWYVPGARLPHEKTGVECFRNLWIRLNGLDSWLTNPDVVALSFTVHRSNIDKLENHR